MIYHAFTKEGYFVAGDSVTGITSIAYPTSEYAEEAKKNAGQTAIEMIAAELSTFHGEEAGKAYDLRNWMKLHDAESCHTVRSILNTRMQIIMEAN